MKDLAKYKTEQEQVDFYNACSECFEEGSKKVEIIERYFNIADLHVAICFAGPALIQDLTGALGHLEISKPLRVDFRIKVWDSLSTGTSMVKPPCEWSDFTDRGDIWGFTSTAVKTAFHWSEYSLNLINHNKKEALYWVEKAGNFPYWVASSPFRSIFNWFLEKHQGQLVHAAAIGNQKDGAILITGKGGVGKSSTALKALNAGFIYLADDYAALRKVKGEYRVYSLYSSAKLMRADLKKYPKLASYVQPAVTDNQEKGVYFLYPGLRNTLAISLRLKAIVAPKILPEKTSAFVPLERSHILEALSFTTMAQLPYSGEYTKVFFNSLVSKVPAAQLQLGSEVELLTETLDNFLGQENLEEFKLSAEKALKVQWPLISVIIPVHNGARFISEALERIAKQDYPALEIIMVDDGSTDQTKQIIEASAVNVRYLFQPQQGPAAARNRGIKVAAANYLAFLDIDDYWPQGCLKRLCMELQNNEQIEVARGYAQVFKKDAKSNPIYVGAPEEAFPDYIGAGLYRARSFKKNGLFDEELTFGEDKDWYNRASENGLVVKRISAVTLMVQRHGQNMTEGKNLVELNMLKTFKKQLNRKRSGQLDLADGIVATSDRDLPSLVVLVPQYLPSLKNTIAQIAKKYPNFLGTTTPFQSLAKADELPDQSPKGGPQTGYCQFLNKAIQDSSADLFYVLKPGFEINIDGLKRMAAVLQDKADLNLILGKPYLEEQPQDHILDLSTCLFKRKAFLKVGQFNPNLKVEVSLLDWFLRAKEAEWLLPLFQKQFVSTSKPLSYAVSDAMWATLKRDTNRVKALGMYHNTAFLKGKSLEKFWNSNRG